MWFVIFVKITEAIGAFSAELLMSPACISTPLLLQFATSSRWDIKVLEGRSSGQLLSYRYPTRDTCLVHLPKRFHFLLWSSNAGVQNSVLWTETIFDRSETGNSVTDHSYCVLFEFFGSYRKSWPNTFFDLLTSKLSE